MQVRMTYQYKLYNNKQNRYLDQAINIAAEIWNHCIALHRRYYRMYGKHLSANRLKVFLVKVVARSLTEIFGAVPIPDHRVKNRNW